MGGVGRRLLRHRLFDNVVMRTVLSVWAWLLLAVLVIVMLPVIALVRVVTAPFDKARYYPGRVFRSIPIAHRALNPLWRFKVTGVKVRDARRPYVVVSNHQSFVDMLLISQLPWEMKWLAKSDFFKYPVVGWEMRMVDDIKLVRGKLQSVTAAMDACRDRLSRRVSVMIFPEGTRSPDGHLQKFKNGAFRLAIETGTAILPLALDGTHSALQKGDWRFGVTEAELRVLPPVETAEMTLDDVASLRDRVHGMIADALDDMRSR
jgi:1-acyl-sn-glycerol-3-phosphate acyltransferase